MNLSKRYVFTKSQSTWLMGRSGWRRRQSGSGVSILLEPEEAMGGREKKNGVQNSEYKGTCTKMSHEQVKHFTNTNKSTSIRVGIN